MSKIIGLVLAAFALISMISASEVANPAELEQVLVEKLKKRGEAETILQEVPEEYRVAVKIGGVSVAEILGYLNTSCSSQTLEDPRLLIVRWAGDNWKYGFTEDFASIKLMSFFHTYIPKRIESCRDNFPRIFKEAVKDFGPDDIKIFSELNHISFSSIKSTKESWEKDVTFHRCVQLIRKISVAKSIDNPWIAVSEEARSLTKKWYGFLELCKRYTERQCEHLYLPYEAKPFGPFIAKKRQEDDEFYDLNKECLSIREIGLSDRTKAERQAEVRIKQDISHEIGSCFSNARRRRTPHFEN